MSLLSLRVSSVTLNDSYLSPLRTPKHNLFVAEVYTPGLGTGPGRKGWTGVVLVYRKRHPGPPLFPPSPICPCVRWTTLLLSRLVLRVFGLTHPAITPGSGSPERYCVYSPKLSLDGSPRRRRPGPLGLWPGQGALLSPWCPTFRVREPCRVPVSSPGLRPSCVPPERVETKLRREERLAVGTPSRRHSVKASLGQKWGLGVQRPILVH